MPDVTTPEPDFFKIVDQDSIEIIDGYRDRCPMLGFRKHVMKVRVYIVRMS